MLRIKNKYIFFILTMLGTLLWTASVSAISVAVFPVDDLSKLHNSVDKEMTQFLENIVARKGLDVIESENVYEFMSKKNIRHLGHLESKMIMSTREVLGADLVILSSLCQKSENPASVGMSIQLIRTSDGITIWSNTSGLSRGSEQRLLGVNAPQTYDDLKELLAQELLTGWPADLDFTAGRELAGAQIAAVKETTYLEVDSVFFTPKVLRPGQKVKCTIRFKSPDTVISKAKVYIKVGSRVHLASSDDGVFYNAAWVGSGAKQVSNVQVALGASDSQVLNQVWDGDIIDADYPVSLILDWPSGKSEESYLGSYIVDSRAPEIFFKMRGKMIDGMLNFRKDLPITVRFKRTEPIKKWEFKVVDESGETVLRERGSSMPPNFKWRGQNTKNLRSDAGIYQISLKVWDRAGNVGFTSEKVKLLSKHPEVDLDIQKHDDDSVIARINSVDNVPVKSWRMELWSENNTLLKTYKGDGLPVRFKLPDFDETIDKDKIACILKVRDELGSKNFIKSENIYTQIAVEKENELEAEETSSASDEWHADF